MIQHTQFDENYKKFDQRHSKYPAVTLPVERIKRSETVAYKNEIFEFYFVQNDDNKMVDFNGIVN